MAAASGTTKTTSFTVNPREVDFVTRFGRNWKALAQILGIMRPIKKAPGTKLVSYEARAKNNTLAGGTVAEGDIIPLTEMEVVEVGYGDIEFKKHGKRTTIEAIAKYGAEIAIQKTDEAFLTELQNGVMNDFYTFLKTGTLKGTMKTWQKALAIAKGAVLEKFASMNRDVTEVVGFANIMDLYNYIGDKDITVQTMFGLNYVENFLGYSTLFLLPSNIIPEKTVIAIPVENIDLYYIDPEDTDFREAGLEFTVDGETNLIGFHATPVYERASADVYAIMGMKLWAEYLDGICIMTVGSSETAPAVAPAS